MRTVLAVGLVLSIPSILNAQADATSVALDVFGANPMAYADMPVTLRGLRVSALVGSQGFSFQVPNQRVPYLAKMLPGAVAAGGVVEFGATVSVTGRVYAMTDSVADAWIADGSLAAEDRRLAVFFVSFIEVSGVTTLPGPLPTPQLFGR